MTATVLKTFMTTGINLQKSFISLIPKKPKKKPNTILGFKTRLCSDTFQTDLLYDI